MRRIARPTVGSTAPPVRRAASSEPSMARARSGPNGDRVAGRAVHGHQLGVRAETAEREIRLVKDLHHRGASRCRVAVEHEQADPGSRVPASRTRRSRSGAAAGRVGVAGGRRDSRRRRRGRSRRRSPRSSWTCSSRRPRRGCPTPSRSLRRTRLRRRMSTRRAHPNEPVAATPSIAVPMVILRRRRLARDRASVRPLSIVFMERSWDRDPFGMVTLARDPCTRALDPVDGRGQSGRNRPSGPAADAPPPGRLDSRSHR